MPARRSQADSGLSGAGDKERKARYREQLCARSVIWASRIEARHSRIHRVLDTLSRQRQMPQSPAGGVGDRVRYGGRGRSLPGFAASEKGLAGTVDDMHIDTLGDRVETQDR